MKKTYICIDLKSFYASVECVERGLNPMTTNLVVADSSRTDKTICLAVTPSLKQYGLSGRSRLYEVVQKVREINRERKRRINSRFTKKSYDDIEIQNNPKVELDYIVAPPRMRCYMAYSVQIYQIYLKYFSKEDINVYSIDEVFIDITDYLHLYGLEPKDLVTKIIQDVYETTGITATAGIGSNLYLAKIAMDIEAKHVEANEQGVRIAELDEISYREKLWSHQPLTDFWRIGRGIASKLEMNGMHTMGDVARYSLEREDKLFKLFGVNAELLIDHAWGWEPCTLDEIKQYKPVSSSLSSGQVLHEPYNWQKTRLIVKEMIELLTLDMVEKHLCTDQIVLTIGYDVSNLTDSKISRLYQGEITSDFYGREVPKASHGTIRIDHQTSSTRIISKELLKLFDTIINPLLLVRRVNMAVCNLVPEEKAKKKVIQQFSLFTNMEDEAKNKEDELAFEKDEIKVQRVMLALKQKYGKNAILRGMNLEEGGTTIMRNAQVGGHKG